MDVKKQDRSNVACRFFNVNNLTHLGTPHGWFLIFGFSSVLICSVDNWVLNVKKFYRALQLIKVNRPTILYDTDLWSTDYIPPPTHPHTQSSSSFSCFCLFWFLYFFYFGTSIYSCSYFDWYKYDKIHNVRNKIL